MITADEARRMASEPYMTDIIEHIKHEAKRGKTEAWFQETHITKAQWNILERNGYRVDLDVGISGTSVVVSWKEPA